MPWQPIDQLPAAEQRLGKASKEFTYSFWHYLFKLGQCALGAIIGGFFLYLAVNSFNDDWKLPILIVVLALGSFIWTGFTTYSTLGWPKLRVKVFPAGLLSIERGRFIILYWGQVEALWQKITIHLDNTPGLPGRRTHKYTVKLTSGEKVVFTDSIRAVAELGEIIEAETTRRMLPQALKRYNEGTPVGFGRLSISQAGLKYGSKTIPLDTIADVSVDNGLFTVKQHGKILVAFGEKTKDIPNLDVLLELLAALRGETGE